MKMKLFALLFVAIFYSKANAQVFELGKVSITELEEKMHPIDSTASAAILFKRGLDFFFIY